MERKTEETESGEGEVKLFHSSDKAMANPVEQILPVGLPLFGQNSQPSLSCLRQSDGRQSYLEGCDTGWGSFLQPRTILKELTARNCLLTALPAALGQQNLP